jgi:hypothetical protein
MATALVLSPVVYPWYLVWLVPFALSLTTLPLLAWSITVLCTYVVWHLKELGWPWVVPDAVLLIEFGAVMAVVVWVVVTGAAKVSLDSDPVYLGIRASAEGQSGRRSR